MTTVHSTVHPCYLNFYMFLPGSRDEDVGVIQEALISLGRLPTRSGRTLVYDALTQKAVAEYQRFKALRLADGRMTGETYAAIGADMGSAWISGVTRHVKHVLEYLLRGGPPSMVMPSYAWQPQVEPAGKDNADNRADQDLTRLLTDTGFVRAAGVGGSRSGPGHFRLTDGKVVTVHVYGDECGNAPAGLYLPAGFIGPTYVVPRRGLEGFGGVWATHRDGPVIGFAHVAVASQAQLQRNYDSGKTNSAGSRYIGDIGGVGGQGATYVHAHIHLYPSAAARARITGKKVGLADPDDSDSPDLRDVRDLPKLARGATTGRAVPTE